MGVLRVFRDPTPQRLFEAIEVAEIRLASLGAKCKGAEWYAPTKDALARAKAAAKAGEIDRGWALVHTAGELCVSGESHLEVLAMATALRLEAAEKLSGWRSRAVEAHTSQILQVEGGRCVLHTDDQRCLLRRALHVRNEGYANQYRDVALIRRYQAILIAIALVILVGSIVGAAFTNREFEDGVAEWWVALAAALSGALGGIASALQRTARRSVSRIPQRIGSLVSSLSRPVIGAIAGITVFLAVRAGITQPSEQQVAYLLLVAFGAGFAERLVVRDPREDAGAEERPPSVPTQSGPLPEPATIESPAAPPATQNGPPPASASDATVPAAATP